jgi:hypothetical protein
MIPEPIVLIGPVYVYFILVAMLVGCGVMRWSKRRWPNIKAYQQLGICFGVMAVVDILAEGLVWLPLGFWEYPGGIPFLFKDTYHKFPINELLTISTMFTAVCALRYFTDDRGRTLVERGVDRLRVGAKRKAAVRTLAIVAAVHLIMLLAYNVPHLFMGANSRGWPDDLQQRSYFTDRMCGPQTDNLCPGDGHGFVVGGRAGG